MMDKLKKLWTTLKKFASQMDFRHYLDSNTAIHGLQLDALPHSLNSQGEVDGQKEVDVPKLPENVVSAMPGQEEVDGPKKWDSAMPPLSDIALHLGDLMSNDGKKAFLQLSNSIEGQKFLKERFAKLAEIRKQSVSLIRVVQDQLKNFGDKMDTRNKGELEQLLNKLKVIQESDEVSEILKDSSVQTVLIERFKLFKKVQEKSFDMAYLQFSKLMEDQAQRNVVSDQPIEEQLLQFFLYGDDVLVESLIRFIKGSRNITFKNETHAQNICLTLLQCLKKRPTHPKMGLSERLSFWAFLERLKEEGGKSLDGYIKELSRVISIKVD